MPSIGERLRAIRERYGFTLREVATRAGIPAERLERIEVGDVCSTAEVAALGDALAVDPAAIIQGKETDLRRSVARFRKASGATGISPNDLRLLARAAEAGRIVRSLVLLLERQPSPLTAARDVRAVGARAAWKEGYVLGEKARQRFAPDMQPIPSMQGCAERLGIHVARVRFETPGIEGASLYEREAAPVILLNDASGRVRFPLARRAVIAHELCHLLHDGGERDLLTIVSREDVSAVEQRANAFAPAFLAPRDWVKTRKRAAAAIVEDIGATWGLSFEGAVWHAHNAKLISDPDWKKLGRVRGRIDAPGFEDEKERTAPIKEELGVQPSPLSTGLLSDLTLEAVARDAISRGRAAEILRLA